MDCLHKEVKQASEEVTFKVPNEAGQWAARSCGEGKRRPLPISSSTQRRWRERQSLSSA